MAWDRLKTNITQHISQNNKNWIDIIVANFFKSGEKL